MAINIPGSNQDNKQDTTSTQTSGQNAQFGRETNSGFNRSLGAMPVIGLGSPMGRNGNGGETFEKIFSEIQKQIKTIGETRRIEEKFNVLKLMKGPAGLRYSNIIVTETLGDVTAAHILIIEKTGDYPDTQRETFNNVAYELLRVPADALDEKLVAETQRTVAEFLSLKNPSDVIIADGTLVPDEFKADNESQLAELMNNTFNATHVEIATRAQNYSGFNLNSLLEDNRNGKFAINLSFNGDAVDILDETGMPIRQDVCVQLMYKRNPGNNQTRSIHQGEDHIELTRTYGYIDFEYVGPTIMGNMTLPQRFVPNFVITKITSPLTLTPDMYMLGVASVYCLNDEMNWMQSFRSTPARKNETDFNDVGALNIEGNLEQSPTGYGKRYATKEKTFTTMELSKLLQNLVHKNMVISIDLPKAGPDTWNTSVFQYIMFRHSKEAYNRVSEYMNTLSNGQFHQLNQGNLKMFLDVSNKIHGGFYRGRDGFRDLRHISSYLAIANHIEDTKQAPALLTQYTNTLSNTNVPAELRASIRKPYIDEMAGGPIVVKQFYDRVTFNSQFLDNWVTALRSINFAPVFSNMGGNGDMFVKRSTVDFSSAMIGANVRLMGANNNVYGGYVPFGMYNRTY